MGGLWRIVEEVVSEMYARGRLEGVVGVTLDEFVVLDTEDSLVEGILGADGDISEEESRILGKGVQQVIVVMTCYWLSCIQLW